MVALIIRSVVTDLDTDCEILWVQIDLIGTKSLHIGSFKGALYIIWCGVNRLGDSGVKVV